MFRELDQGHIELLTRLFAADFISHFWYFVHHMEFGDSGELTL